MKKRPITGSVYAERGRWVCEFKTHPKLGRVRVAFDTSREAEALRAHIAAYGAYPEAFLRGQGVDPTRTWNAALDALRASGGPDQRWRSKPQDGSQRRIHEYLRGQPIGGMAVEAITYDVLEDLATKLGRGQGQRGNLRAPRTISKYMVAITVVLTYAVKKGWIARLPLVPKVTAPPHVQPLYTDTMLVGLCGVLEGLGEPVAAFCCRLLHHTALRVGELLGLRPADIDAECVLLMDPTRTKNEKPRIVHIGTEPARELKALVAAGKLPKYRRLHHLVTHANQICGYEMVRPLHAFRHTAASSITADDTMSLEMAQELLGHKDPKTTQLYRDKSVDFLRKRAIELSQRRGKIGGMQQAPVLISLNKKVS